MADAGDVGRHLDAVGQPDARHLAERRVRFLRSLSEHPHTDAALLGADLERGTLRLGNELVASLANELTDGRHLSSRRLVGGWWLVVALPAASPGPTTNHQLSTTNQNGRTGKKLRPRAQHTRSGCEPHSRMRRYRPEERRARKHAQRLAPEADNPTCLCRWSRSYRDLP